MSTIVCGVAHLSWLIYTLSGFSGFTSHRMMLRCIWNICVLCSELTGMFTTSKRGSSCGRPCWLSRKMESISALVSP